MDRARGETVWAVCAFAREGGEIDVAGCGILDQAVLDSVVGVTRFEDCAMNHGVLARGNMVRRIFKGLIGEPESPAVAAYVGRVAGDDAVKLLWIASSL